MNVSPLSGEKPSQLQKKPSILQTMREQGEKSRRSRKRKLRPAEMPREASGHIGPRFSVPLRLYGASRIAGTLTERRFYAGRSKPKTVALSIRTTKLTGKVLAAALGKVARLQKHHRKALTPQGRQSVKS